MPNKICRFYSNLIVFTISVSNFNNEWYSFFMGTWVSLVRTWRYKSFIIPVILNCFDAFMLSALCINCCRLSSRLVNNLVEAHNSSQTFIFRFVHVSINTVWQKGLERSLGPFVWISYLFTVFASNVSVEVRAVIINVWTFISMIAKLWTVICKDWSNCKAGNL